MQYAKRSRRARLAGAVVLAGLASVAAVGSARAAIAPWYPRDGEDRCKVVAGAAPQIDTVPPRWQEQILRDFGWVGQDPRIYTVPAILACRQPRQSGDSWSCHPNFLEWAKRNCRGLEIRQ